jgi:hypothetical protein
MDAGADDDDGGDDEPCADPPCEEALRVLYLGDNAVHTAAIYEALVDAGFDVTDASPFETWDGVLPDVNDFDVVVYLQGVDYGDDLMPAADTALTAWMLAGGTVIRSEWIAFQIGAGVMDETDFDQYLPVESPDSEYDYSTMWTVAVDAHPLVAGLPQTWINVDGGCAVVGEVADAVVVATSDVCGPALTYKEYGSSGGMVIHINDDFGHDEGEEPDPNTMAILLNAVRFSAM